MTPAKVATSMVTPAILETASEMTATSDDPARSVSSAPASVACVLIQPAQEIAHNAANARRVKSVTPKSISAWKILAVMAINSAKKVKYVT